LNRKAGDVDHGPDRGNPPGDDPVPDLSIVLIVRHPQETPDAVLAALAAEPGIETVEVIVVDGRPGATGPATAGPLQVGTLLRATGNMPRLKAEGAAWALGASLAFLEPKAIPVGGWLAAARAALARHPGAALGGAVSLAGGGAADRAAYLFEYGAFPPEIVAQGTTTDLPGNNMILPAKALRRVCADILGEEGLNKPFCQERLRAGGTAIIMVPGMQVGMVTCHRLPALLASRYRYARCFGGTRAALAGRSQRWRYRLGAPAVPVLLLARHLARAMRGRRPGLATLTALSALCLAWSVGEALGSWAGPGRSCERLY